MHARRSSPTSRQVLDDLRQHGLSHLLIDTTDLDMESISHSETQFIGHHIAQTFPATRDIKIAFIVNPATQKELFDVIARRGGTKLSVFAEKSDALDWLLG